ncbi:hypothetical protein AAVH_27039, partial [Aphelenchoides avenae]
FKHTIIGFRNDSIFPYVGYINPNSSLPDCARAQYERSTYVDAKSFHTINTFGFVINRVPADSDCQQEIWQQYQAWKTDVEAEHNMTLADLW